MCTKVKRVVIEPLDQMKVKMGSQIDDEASEAELTF